MNMCIKEQRCGYRRAAMIVGSSIDAMNHRAKILIPGKGDVVRVRVRKLCRELATT
jgi:hypothetical protein